MSASRAGDAPKRSRRPTRQRLSHPADGRDRVRAAWTVMTSARSASSCRRSSRRSAYRRPVGSDGRLVACGDLRRRSGLRLSHGSLRAADHLHLRPDRVHPARPLPGRGRQLPAAVRIALRAERGRAATRAGPLPKRRDVHCRGHGRGAAGGDQPLLGEHQLTQQAPLPPSRATIRPPAPARPPTSRTPRSPHARSYARLRDPRRTWAP